MVSFQVGWEVGAGGKSRPGDFNSIYGTLTERLTQVLTGIFSCPLIPYHP